MAHGASFRIRVSISGTESMICLCRQPGQAQ
jgi:hypothetical protein